MAESSEKQERTPESPATARPLDSDEGQQETGIIHNDGAVTSNEKGTPKRSSRSQSRVRFKDDEDAPPKPPRPLSPNTQAENTLIEAFPTIDSKVVRAVLVASNGQVEPAFNALLGMSDPDSLQEVPPPQPPRPTAQQRQMEQDEMYARQLAQQYNTPGGRHGQTQPMPEQAQRRSSRPPMAGEDREHSFFDDDLPEIRENLRQGFVQTQTRFNKWISDFRKNFNESDDDAPVAGQGTVGRRQNFGASQSEQLHGIQRQAEASNSRRSQDQHRYDPDPQVMSGDFEALELRDDEDNPPPKPARPQANPNLFKPTPPTPPQSGPVDEVDALYQNPLTSPNRQPSPSTGKSKKWQPLTSVARNPEAEDNDPFALGDSDEEDSKKKDIRAEDSERLKRSANQVGGASIEEGDGSELKLEPSRRSGSGGQRNAEAEEILDDKKESG